MAETKKKVSLLGLLANEKVAIGVLAVEDQVLRRFGEKTAQRRVGGRRKVGLLFSVGGDVLVMTSIPFAAKALVGTVPALALEVSRPVTLQEMVEDFCRQLEKPTELLENVMQSGAATIVIHCKSEKAAVIVLNSGLCFREYPLDLKPAPSITWVKLTRVVYGTTENAVKSRMSEYGNVLKVRRETVNGIGISVYSVKIDLKKPIPSRISIAHYPVNVFYRGQVQQCFKCEQTGHLSKNCPRKKSQPEESPDIVGPSQINLPDSVPEPTDGISADVGQPTSIEPIPDNVSDPIDAISSDVQPSSIESMETTVNESTGKRQHKPTREDPPVKVAKIPTISYAEYERERTRMHVKGDDATDEENDDFEQLLSRIPPAMEDAFVRTFSARHPLLVDPVDHKDLAHELKQAFEAGVDLGGVLSVESTELLQPKLSSVLQQETPLLRYPDVEDFLRSGLLGSQGLVIKKTSLITTEQFQAFKTQQSQLLSAYMEHFYTVYPELMESAGLTPERQDTFLKRIEDRDT